MIKDPYEWMRVTGHAQFSRRYAHAALLNREQKFFVLGGAIADLSEAEVRTKKHGGYLHDVWTSTTFGKSWEMVTPRSPKFSPRRGHAAVMDTDKVVMFVLGGFCGRSCFKNDWWNSENGDVWNPMGDAPWSARHGLAAVMLSSNLLVVMAGPGWYYSYVTIV